MTRVPSLFLFDIDGTLLLSGGAGSRVLDRVFQRHHGIANAMSAVSPGGKTDPLIVGEMFENLGRAPTQLEYETIMRDYEAELMAEMRASAGFTVFQDVREVLSTLAAVPTVTMAVATGNSEQGAMAKLECADLGGFFVCGGYGSDSAERSELVEAAIKRAESHQAARFARERIVVVGDTPRDVAAAKACGVQVVAVTTGRPGRDELRGAGAELVIDRLGELLAISTDAGWI